MENNLEKYGYVPISKSDHQNYIDVLAERDKLKSINLDLLEALKQIAQIQRDKCETASAEMLFIVLDNKIGIAERAIERATEKDEETP